MGHIIIKGIEIVGTEGKSNSFLMTTWDTFEVGAYYVLPNPNLDIREYFKCTEVKPKVIFRRVCKEDIPEGVTPLSFKCDWGK